MRTKPYRAGLLKQLKNREYALEYLSQAADSGDPAVWSLALKDVVEARVAGLKIGVRKLAKELQEGPGDDVILAKCVDPAVFQLPLDSSKSKVPRKRNR
jgi:ribosomal protein L7Ae-like RNA K-turn-binding protein